MSVGRVPDVLAVIPDGNRRWARRHRLSLFSGYNLGVKKFIDFAEWCKDYGVRNIIVWAFSTENFNRPTAEREMLFNLYRKMANDKDLIARLHKNETRFNIVGNKNLLPKDLMNALHRIEIETGKYKNRVINMLIAYGGRDDILHAAKEMVKYAIKKNMRDVTETLFRANMISSQIPDIDLVIRTSGEERLSGFMPWQTGYSELYFVNKLWPDFTKRDLEKALEEYKSRQRRFGE